MSGVYFSLNKSKSGRISIDEGLNSSIIDVSHVVVMLRSHLPVIDAVCKAALPSTLVKALYLFFDLPPTSDEKVADLRRSVFTRFLTVSHVHSFG